MRYALCVVNHGLSCAEYEYWLSSLIAQVILLTVFIVSVGPGEDMYCMAVAQREEVISETTFV